MNYRQRIQNEGCITVDRLISLSRTHLTEQARREPWKYSGRHGVSILTTDEQLDAYNAAYGEMHARKLLEVFRSFPFDSLPDEVEIVDWGCGQGIATLILLEVLRERQMSDIVKRITLIEPSEAAIDRAEANIDAVFHGAGLSLAKINKCLPSDNDYTPSFDNSLLQLKKDATIHLFSNVLDILEISLEKTAALILSPGQCCKHFIVCVGPVNDNSSRIDDFCDILGADDYFSNTYKSNFGYVTGTDHFFSCKTKGFVLETEGAMMPASVSTDRYTADGNFDDYDIRAALHFLEGEEILAVMTTGYQLLVSAKGRQLDYDDDPSIDIIYRFCGFDGSELANMFGDMFWNKAVDCNPYEAFRIVSEFKGEKKEALIKMLNQLCEKDNTLMRRRCFDQLVYIAGL